MRRSGTILREHARAIWQAGVDAVAPERLMRAALQVRRGKLKVGSLSLRLNEVRSIAVVGTGKAGASMSRALEAILGDELLESKRLTGCVNVPDRLASPLHRIHLHPSRSAPDNKPTEAGVEGARRIRRIMDAVGPADLVICLLSGGGSALLPAPVPSVSLVEKQAVTGQLHACGATIGELNAVRKHLSDLKGGGLATNFHGGWLVSLIISDVVGDPLDVIASGPTAVDTSTYADAIGVLQKYELWEKQPPSVRDHLQAGLMGKCPETLKKLPPRVHNFIIGNNGTAVAAAAHAARRLGYRLLNLSCFIEGDSKQVGIVLAGVALGIRQRQEPFRAPVCVLSGGETTVNLGSDYGLGGRNQELVLAALNHLGLNGLRDLAILSGGTDGEDGPTDAAGAFGDETLLRKAVQRDLLHSKFLDHHDAYHFFEPLGGLLKTGLTETNVTDLRVLLVGPAPERQ